MIEYNIFKHVDIQKCNSIIDIYHCLSCFSKSLKCYVLLNRKFTFAL